MKPVRLFAILVLLTASALAVVYFRVASVRTAHHVQQLHAEQVKLHRQADRLEADIASRCNPQAVRKWADKVPTLTQYKLPAATPDTADHADAGND